MSRTYFGTAGWSYSDWEGIVYPKTRGRDFQALTFLAGLIDIVEVNSTFYRMPVINISLSWVRKVEAYPDFLFTVKLHQVFTHGRRDFSMKDVEDFKSGINPLRAARRLAAILIQFPWSFKHSTASIDLLTRLFTMFRGYPLALEVRHGSWTRLDFRGFLQDYDVGLCNIDQPQFPNSIKPGALSTSPEFAYVRLHGRNVENWFKKDAGRDARYDYLYSTDELREWADRIRQLGTKSEKVYVVSNNHYRGQALANTLQLKNMITGQKLDIPVDMLERYPVLKEIARKKVLEQPGLFDDEQ